MQRTFLAVFVALGFVSGGVNLAHADAIDGTWCSERDHRQLTVAGPSATLPGGQRVTGEYSRHRFSYIVPMPDVQAGRVMVLRLMGEMAMISVSASADGASPSEPENWKRCELTS